MKGAKITNDWRGLLTLEKDSFSCGYCGAHSSSASGFIVDGMNPSTAPKIRVCANCNQPTFIRYAVKKGAIVVEEQIPHPQCSYQIEFGEELLDSLFGEARRSFEDGSYTSCVMMCRKLLMHIAHDCGSDQKHGKNFADYCDYLKSSHNVHENFFPALDSIRRSGNKANHEIERITEYEASYTMQLMVHLVSNIYHAPKLTAEVDAQPSESATSS